MYDAIERDQSKLSERERMLVDFATRFARDHESLDESHFDRLKTHFRDDELLDVTVCTARFLSMGRITRVLRLDHDSCPPPWSAGEAS